MVSPSVDGPLEYDIYHDSRCSLTRAYEEIFGFSPISLILIMSIGHPKFWSALRSHVFLLLLSLVIGLLASLRSFDQS